MRSNNSQIHYNKDNYAELLAGAFFIYYIPLTLFHRDYLDNKVFFITLVFNELLDTYLLDWLPLP